MSTLFVGTLFLAFCGLIGLSLGGHSTAGILAGLAVFVAAETSLHFEGRKSGNPK